MPDEAYNSAIFDASEDGRSTSGLTVLVELASGCAGCDTPAGSPGGGLMISGCAGCGMPSDRPRGGSMTNTAVVATGLGPGVGPEVGPGVGSPDTLWSVPHVRCRGRRSIDHGAVPTGGCTEALPRQ